MHIKSVDVAGFKSFVDRTVIHFDHDVVGIIGPNGCGKSNIVDAIRWCMGEQSAKHLRGQQMQDVIFNGSESRKAHGIAEVTLTFDNTDAEYAQSLPEEYRDFPEIAVTRRLFRDGTSEYLLNKTTVRLRDITDLFLGTGVGTKAYSIVEQGRIGQIVTARPEQRRLFIEEAAGVTKYRQRKRETERKMELTRQNLLRISDIVAEKERNRNSLKRQAAKAERYTRYRGELEELMLHDASHRLLEMIVTGRVEQGQYDTAVAQASTARADVAEHEATLEAARAESEQIEKQAEKAAIDAVHAENEVTAQQQEINHAKEQLLTLREQMAAADSDREATVERIGSLQTEIASLEAELNELGSDEEGRAEITAAEERKLEELTTEQQGSEAEATQLRQTVADLGTHAASAEARLSALAERIEERRSRRDQLHAELETLRGELANLGARQHALETNVAEVAEGKRLTVAEREALARELEELRTTAREAEHHVEAAKAELGLKRNRLRALEDLHRRLDGVNAGVRALMSSSDDTVRGLVADRIEAPEHLTAALASQLGDRLQCVVVADPERGLELLRDLRENEGGRATIVPVRPPYVAGNRPMLPEGAVGFLADMVQYAPEDEALVRTLIGDTIVTETAGAAVELSRRIPGLTSVSLDGTVARGNGMVSGGSGDDVAAGMVEQKREMHHLADEVADLEKTAQARAAEFNRIRARMTEVGTALDRAREGAHEGELAQVTVEKDLARSKGDIERNRQRMTEVGAEIQECDRVLERVVHEEGDSRSDLDRVRLRLEQAQQALVKAEETASSWKERVAAQNERVTELRVRLAQVKEQADAKRVSLDNQRTALKELEERARRLEESALEAARDFGEIAGRLVRAVEAKEAAVAAEREARKLRDESHALLEQVRHGLATKEARLKELRLQLEELDSETRRREMKLQEIEIERRHLIEGVFEKFRQDLPRIVGDYHKRPPPDEEHRRRIDELTRLIDRMGPVNVDAEREFEVEDAAFQEMSGQKKDIEDALANIEKSIRYMNRESRRMFRDAFHSINELFKTTFKRLFAGGRASLELTDDQDVLETGVEIVAQPPGKRLGNIDLMSGGEKALTAAALIFAIFRHRPSPFCVLDEVDAPLDEANVGRYVEIIREMTDHSQFILITHVKRTMQSVDALYGVTMHEPGVSQIVSVKMNEAAVARSERRHDVLETRRPPPASTEPVEDEGTQVA